MRTVFAFALVFYALSPAAQAAASPTGQNCALRDPPVGAGEDMNHGYTLKVYPRLTNISKNYTGCQTLWGPSQTGGWERDSVTYVERGDPVRIFNPHNPTDERFSCTYRHGVVTSGEASQCVAPQFLLKGSLPPGCVERIKRDPQLFDKQDCKYD